MTKNNDQIIFDVVISGGGMVGMSLAVGLARKGMQIAVIERTAMPQQLDPTFDGRVSAISLGSAHILDAAGAWHFMLPYAEPITDIRVSEGGTPFFLHYDHREVGEAPFGYIVENRYIRHGLHLCAEGIESLHIIDQTSIESFKDSNADMAVTLSNGRQLRCRLLIGADGKQSFIRSKAGIGEVQWQYGQTAIVCTIEHELPHQGLAQERFLPAGPFAVLPMTQNRSSLVWVEPDERVKTYLALPEEDFAQEIVERVGHYLGKIHPTGPRFAYPLSLMHAKSYIAPRLALIGDAAHAIHPIAGQGVNLGFRDVGVLSELLIERFKLGLDIGSEEVLAHYQRWRRFDNTTMLTVTDALTRLFSNHILPLKIARNMGLWAVGQMPTLKQFFMRHAMGLVGDIPESVKKRV